MEQNPSNNSGAPRRKMKFVPRAAPRRIPKPEVKEEISEEADSAQAKKLLQHFNENTMRAKQRIGKKAAPTQVAFGSGGTSSTLRSYGHQTVVNRQDGTLPSSKTKEYVEPWDLYSNYPVTLPLRKGYLGNPETLNEEEFGEASENRIYDENAINPAIDLGLKEENPETNIFFLQLPPMMPVMKKSSAVEVMAPPPPPPKASEKSGGSEPEQKKISCSLNELPPGSIGKLLVYRSGAVKLKLGDILYDVSPGMDCGFAQDVAAINVEGKHCCIIGELNKRAVLTPDLDSMLKNIEDL